MGIISFPGPHKWTYDTKLGSYNTAIPMPKERGWRQVSTQVWEVLVNPMVFMRLVRKVVFFVIKMM